MNKNKIALITGATSGIGESTSNELSDHFSLILCGRNKKKLKELSNTLSKKTNVTTLVFDVRDKKDVREKISSLSDDWKNIDVLINNAGNAHGLDFIYEGEIEDWDMTVSYTHLTLPTT